MKTSLAQLLAHIPGAPSKKWPEGERYAEGFSHGSMSIGLYAPLGRDPQTPHSQDELYVVHSGTAVITISGQEQPCAPGDAFFVGAQVEHRFHGMSADFRAWVVFWGPKGGEPSA
jgi:mannose-6-phosphate isomerase-like protein (cupin superfamily)